MQLNNRLLELEMENKNMREEKCQLEVELTTKMNLLEK